MEQITSYRKQLNSLHDEIAEVRAGHKVSKTIDAQYLGSKLAWSVARNNTCLLARGLQTCITQERHKIEKYNGVLPAHVLALHFMPVES